LFFGLKLQVLLLATNVGQEEKEVQEVSRLAPEGVLGDGKNE
jgi:hypothetical protein